MKGQGGQPPPTTPRPQPTKPPTRPPDEICHPNPCQNGGTCKATRNGGYRCICLVGYSGSHCQGEKHGFRFALLSGLCVGDVLPTDLLLQ